MFPLLLLAMTTGADPKPTETPGDVAIQKYLRAEVAALDKNFMDGAKTKEAWTAKRPKLQEQMFDMLGLSPRPEKTDLHATVTGTIDVSEVTIEKIHFQSRPGLYVTGNLYRPRLAVKDKKLPAVLYLCGHSNLGRDGNKAAYQHYGMWFAHNGYVCFVIDTLQLGEVAGKHHGTYNLGRWWWHSRGYTPAGVECWNGIRAIDYLCTRPDVDADKIGVTGRSGGGATTVWLAATDDRVKVAVPVSGMSDLGDYVGERAINGHCDCMFAYNPYRWEWTTILALFAPKPLMFANGDADPIFPMPGNRRIAERLRKCYEMLGATDAFEEVVDKNNKHEDTPALRKASFRFFNTHLKGDADAKVEDTEFAKIAGQDLRVFPDDKDLPKDSINAKADETFVPVADVKVPAKPEEFAAWKAGLLKELKEKCFVGWPEGTPKLASRKGEKAVEILGKGAHGWELDTHPYVGVQVYVEKRPSLELGNKLDPGSRITLIVSSTQDDLPLGDVKWHTLIRPKSDVLTGLLYRGVASNAWARKNPPNTVERSMALVGKTVDQGRVMDVLATVAYLDEKAGGKATFTLLGRGDAGVIAAYAAMFDKRISQVILHEPPTTHDDGPYFLGVRRVLDIPDALGLLAPDIKVTITGKTSASKSFDKTEAIFKLAGAKGKLKRE